MHSMRKRAWWHLAGSPIIMTVVSWHNYVSDYIPSPCQGVTRGESWGARTAGLSNDYLLSRVNKLNYFAVISTSFIYPKSRLLTQHIWEFAKPFFHVPCVGLGTRLLCGRVQCINM